MPFFLLITVSLFEVHRYLKTHYTGICYNDDEFGVSKMDGCGEWNSEALKQAI